MASDAALAIVSTATVGFAAVVASTWGVWRTTSTQVKLARIAAQREPYAYFLSVEAKTFSLCQMHRSAGCPENPARQAEIAQDFHEMRGAYGAVTLAGGTRLGVLALEVITRIGQYHLASVPGMSPDEDFPTLNAYSVSTGNLTRAMQSSLGMKPVRPQEWRGLMWPAG